MANETIIGAQLREARLDKKITLDELQQLTKVQKRYLEALEQGDFSRLPGEYYIRTFIRQYAQAVGKDGDKLVAAFEGDDNQILPELPKREQVEEVASTRSEVHTQMSRRSKQKDAIPIWILGSIALVIVIIVSYIALQDYKSTPLIESSATVEKEVSKTTQTTTHHSSTKESRSTSRSTSTSNSKKEQLEMSVTQLSATQTQVAINQAKEPITFSFTGANGPCWLGVLINGSYVYQYTLQAGQTQTYTLPNQVSQAAVVLGASDNVEIKVNKQKLDFKNANYPATKKTLQFAISYQSSTNG